MKSWRALILAVFGGISARAGESPSLPAVHAPLLTRWAAAVGPSNALPEYPRPQLVRADWVNLNGLWDFAVTPEAAGAPAVFSTKILVPFPVESTLSGVRTNLPEHMRMWYRRNFSVPASWRGRRVRLHFGAVDWKCRIRVNGRAIGLHQGGYDAFAFDITDALKWDGAEELSADVTDPTEGDQPRGKQARAPDGIFYTSTSGIWQTVWLEPVPILCIDSIRTVPDVDGKSARLFVSVNGFGDQARVRAVARADGHEVGSITGPANAELVLKVPSPRLWTPDDPFLYDLTVTLEEDGRTMDSVSSYFGMRKIALRKDDQGVTRMALNDQFTFEIGALDQGFWPDGIYTAPTDEALRSDIEFLKKCGFNLARKHVKVEPDRWYYWCDKLGLLVWQDMPSGNNATPEAQRDFENELRRMVEGLQNHPSIIVWVLFNEGWGQFDTERLAARLKQLDPSRLVDDASGWTDVPAGDLIDMHNYPGPDAPQPEPRRASVLGEFGGLGLATPGHLWSSNSWGYVMLPETGNLASRYALLFKHVWRMNVLRGLSAVVYTQTTDVETECNGLQTYDRAVVKIDPAEVRAANHCGFSRAAERIVLADGLSGRVTWKYTFDSPSNGWFKADFDARSWLEGPGGFASAGTPGVASNTKWNTADIWLRRDFSLKPEELTRVRLEVFHDEDIEIYLNGILALQLPGFITDYDEFDISNEAAATLRPGRNTIAVHCHQTTGGQGVDVGIMRTVSENTPAAAGP